MWLRGARLANSRAWGARGPRAAVRVLREDIFGDLLGVDTAL